MKVLLSFLFLLCFGCIKIKDKNSGGSADSVASDQALTSSKLITYKVVSSDQPNQFSFQFQWDSSQAPQIAKIISSNKTRVEMIPQGSSWTDTSGTEAQEVTYDFGFYENNQWVLLQSLKIRKPMDLVITETKTWSQIQNEFEVKEDGIYHLKDKYRIYLGPQAQLVTEGRNLALDIPEIYASPGSSISTWTLNQTAGNEKAGRPGGQLKIKTNFVHGLLAIYLRGENGGKGKAADPDEHLKGLKGRSGKDSVHEGQLCATDRCMSNLRCLMPPTDGEAGSHGLQGKTGFAGHRGGNSGFAEIEVRIGETQNIVLSSEPGSGGPGGDGGPGGAGGDGGDPGRSKVFFVDSWIKGPCPEARSGAQGPTGANGQSGPRGSDGLKENSWVKYQGQISYF